MEEKNLLKEQLNGYLGDYSDLDMLVEFVQKELDRAREEVIKNLIKKIEEANCDSISLELLREIDLSKLTTK